MLIVISLPYRKGFIFKIYPPYKNVYTSGKTDAIVFGKYKRATYSPSEQKDLAGSYFYEELDISYDFKFVDNQLNMNNLKLVCFNTVLP